jgi:hypothetical protein
VAERQAQASPHWQSVPQLQVGPQAQARLLWQPQVQVSPGQSRHWQGVVSISFMTVS